MKPILNTTIAGVAALLVLVACENVGSLEPVNAEGASGVGAVPHFTFSGTGAGSLEIVMPSGEVMNGSFGPPYADTSFGTVFKDVYGQYSTLPVAANNGSPTVADLKGNQGGTMKCEFYNDNNTNHGFGGCKTSRGALYRLNY